MPLEIVYESEGFPAGGPVRNGSAILQTSWDELLWAAVTVGRPNRSYVFRHGRASRFEAMFRWSLTRMALEQTSPTARRLRRTDAAKSLDPSEKGAVNYFVGMTMCKLFAEKLLRAPWVIHLDVFRPLLDPVLTGRSRPDLIGQMDAGDWVALESKGRASQPNDDAKEKAKQQAQRVVSIQGTAPRFRVGAISYYRDDVLRFFWRDPRPAKSTSKIEVPTSEDAWRYYYSPVFEFVLAQQEEAQAGTAVELRAPSPRFDLTVEIEAVTFKLLQQGLWSEAKNSCQARRQELTAAGYQADGIRVIAGESWKKPFVDTTEVAGTEEDA